MTDRDIREPNQPFAGKYPTEDELNQWRFATMWVRMRAAEIVDALCPGGQLHEVESDLMIGYYASRDDVDNGVLSYVLCKPEWFTCADWAVPVWVREWMDEEKKRQDALEAARAAAAQKAAEYRAREERRKRYEELAKEFGPWKSTLVE